MPEANALTTTRLLFAAQGLGPVVAPPTNGPTPDRQPRTVDPTSRAPTRPNPTRQILSVGLNRRRMARFSLCCLSLGFDFCVVIGYYLLVSRFSGVVCLFRDLDTHLYHRPDIVSTDVRPESRPHH